MTISEEKKEKIIELFEKGLNKKMISRATQVSYPTIKNILNDKDIKQNQEEISERNEIVRKKLEEIFAYENCTEEAILDLIFNLKRIAEVSGSEIGEFIEDIEFIFDKYHKYTEKPIELFNFIVDISSNLSLVFDSIEPEPFLKIVEDYYENGMKFNEAKESMIEIEVKAERLVENAKEEYNIWQEEINNAQKECESITSLKSIMLKKMIDEPNLKKLKFAEESVKALQINAHKLETINQVLTIKLKQTDKENKEAKQELLLFNLAFERINKLFPEEVGIIIKEIENENQ